MQERKIQEYFAIEELQQLIKQSPDQLTIIDIIKQAAIHTLQ